MNVELVNILRELTENREAFLTRSVEGKIYVRKFAVRERLILLGAGHVARAVAKIAALSGWSVTVIDDRQDFADSSAFPDAERVMCGDFPNMIHEAGIRGSDYVCVMTHGHTCDVKCIRTILDGTFPRYLGMLSSRRRVEALTSMLRDEGYSSETLGRLHAPVGLKIRAQTPAEIAVSIVAEMIAERHSPQESRDCLKVTATDYASLRAAAESQGPCVMMLVLETSGPVPVKSGAVMFMTEDGRTFGTVGGGTVEYRAVRSARKLLGSGRSEVLTADLREAVTDDSENVCGGLMKILIEDLCVRECQR